MGTCPGPRPLPANHLPKPTGQVTQGFEFRQLGRIRRIMTTTGRNDRPGSEGDIIFF
jgi:hypothetical protein